MRRHEMLSSISQYLNNFPFFDFGIHGQNRFQCRVISEFTVLMKVAEDSDSKKQEENVCLASENFSPLDCLINSSREILSPPPLSPLMLT